MVLENPYIKALYFIFNNILIFKIKKFPKQLKKNFITLKLKTKNV